MVVSGQQDWDQLLQQTSSLAAQDGQGFPQLERDFRQVEALSSRLKEKAFASADTLAATRFLSQEGVNARSLDRALQTVELKQTYEDVFQLEGSSIEEYLEQVHEMTVLTAIQEAQQDTLSAFESYVADRIEADWAACKRQFFDSLAPERILAASWDRAGDSMALTTTGSGAAATLPSAAATQLSEKERAYLDVVKSVNEAELSRQPLDAVPEFAAAAAKGSAGQHKCTIGMLWSVLAGIVREASDNAGAPLPPRGRASAMLRGACKHLEAGHAQHVEAMIQSNRAQANLGGAPSRRSQIYAYLRIREGDLGPLDFDVPGGVDTTWHRIFLCLRSGFWQEALEEARKARDAPLMRGQSFASHLQDWIKSGGRLNPDASLDMAEMFFDQLFWRVDRSILQECERLSAAADRHSWHQGGFRHKFACHALLSGDRRAADTLLRNGSTLATIEDFMWFMLALVRSSPAAAGGASRSSSGGDGYKLSDLQAYLGQFPAAHYSKDGEEPLMYAMILLLSLQFQPLLAFLARDGSARAYRVDAPHFAAALFHSKVLDAGGADAKASESATSPGRIVHQYALHYAQRAPEIAIEYYMLAARMLGGGVSVTAGLVRELLTESDAFGYLLGSGGTSGGALDRWLGDGAERRRLLESVASDCEREAQLEWAAELFLYAGSPRPALHLLNLQLSDVLEASLRSQAHDRERESLFQRASEASRMLAGSTAPADEAEKTTLLQLRTVDRLLRAAQGGDDMAVVTLLPDLGFLPTDGFRVQRCAEAMPSLHPALAQRVPSLLRAAAKALAATGQVAQLRTIVAFAGQLPERISQSLFQELNDLYNGVA